jgi:hypothetical protein
MTVPGFEGCASRRNSTPVNPGVGSTQADAGAEARK